jgi:3-deoxy-D-manno-octulosonic-acid transferase
MLFLYRISVGLYHFLIWLIAPFNHRAKTFSQERSKVFNELEREFSDPIDHVAWFHAASLGEFEQAKPVIERLKSDMPYMKVLVTFFSPAGYQVVKKNELLDFVHYLPEDSPTNAHKFIKLVRPKVAVFVKYELWYFFLTELKRTGVSTLLISGIFRKNQLYFHPLGAFYKKAFDSFAHFYLQDDYSSVLLRKLGYRNWTITGDTRFDRVIEISNSDCEFPILDAFCNGEKKVMILGSVWLSDMEHLWSIFNDYSDHFKFIVAPHNLDSKALKPFLELPRSVKYSQVESINPDDNIMIVDQFGILSKIYRFAHITIVGGAFRGTLHNTLEPAVYGLPVFFGSHPNNEKFVEARELQTVGGGFTFENYNDLKVQLDQMIENQRMYEIACVASSEFVKSRSGAASKVASRMKEVL